MTSFTACLDPVHRLVALILLLVGCPFFSIGLYEAMMTHHQLNTFVAVQGTVIDNTYATTNSDDSASGAYYPVVEFKPRDGQVRRFTDGIGSLPPNYAVGAQVEVLYNPQDVSKVRIYSWMRLWFAPTLLVGIGLFPILALLVLIAVAQR